MTMKHLTNSEGTNDGVVIPQGEILMKSPSSSSESSVDSSYVEKYDSSDLLLKSNLNPKGVGFAPEVSAHNPTTCIHESSAAVSPQNELIQESSAAVSPQNDELMQSGGLPDRIPSSLFDSRPTTPLDWSVASTESLFSIGVGNNSFPRENVVMQYKSGEFPKFEDTKNPPPCLIPVTVAEPLEKKTEDISEDAEVTDEKPVESARAVEPELPPNNINAVPVETEKNISQGNASPVVDVRNSTSSTQSFQFPVFEANAAGTGSAEMVKEKQPSMKQPKEEPQPQKPETPPKPRGNSWLSCFPSCCSIC